MTLRQEATKYFLDIPDNKLAVIIPLLKDYAENCCMIETDLTDEEKRIIAEGEEEYKKGTYVSWSDYKANRRK